MVNFKHKIVMTGGRRYRPAPGNIDMNKTTFRDKWPNGRPYKHGAMEVFFIFRPESRISAEADVESLMELQGWERGTDYHIPGWNYNPGYTWNTDFWKDSLMITFNDDETFVMAKLSWDQNIGVEDET